MTPRRLPADEAKRLLYAQTGASGGPLLLTCAVHLIWISRIHAVRLKTVNDTRKQRNSHDLS